MSPPILHIRDVALTFGGEALIESAEFQVFSRSRICLVGRNGSGKSTLMKIIAGMVEIDHGERFIGPGVTLRYLPQEPDMGGFATVLDYVEEGLSEIDDRRRAARMLNEFGLTGDEPPSRLSGGETRRAAIVRTLAPQPDILLLDEPTNHLDLPAIEWLEAVLAAARSAIVMVSHDRRFLERLSRQTVWIDRGRTRLLDYGFAKFENWRDELLDHEQSERHKLGRKIVREEHWITHGVSGRRRRNIRRLAELSTLKDTRSRDRKSKGQARISVAEGVTSGKLVLKARSITKAYGERVIIKEFSAIIGRGERVGIVGANGVGKTTLVDLLTGRLAPDAGTLKHGTNLEILHLDQKRETLDPQWTLREALTDGAGDMVAVGDEHKHVMTYMGEFLFTPEQAGTPLHALSGGERGRLTLARGLRHPSNLLVLDEPTNDLDLETLELLQETIAEYPGTVIVISHDRDFLDRVCTSIVAAEDSGIWVEYAGGYSDMLAQKFAVVQPVSPPSPKKGKRNASARTVERATASKSRLSFKQKHALAILPGELQRLQFEIGRIKSKLADPALYAQDQKKFAAFSDALAEREQLLATAEQEWLELEMLREQIEG